MDKILTVSTGVISFEEAVYRIKEVVNGGRPPLSRHDMEELLRGDCAPKKVAEDYKPSKEEIRMRDRDYKNRQRYHSR